MRGAPASAPVGTGRSPGIVARSIGAGVSVVVVVGVGAVVGVVVVVGAGTGTGGGAGAVPAEGGGGASAAEGVSSSSSADVTADDDAPRLRRSCSRCANEHTEPYVQRAGSLHICMRNTFG